MILSRFIRNSISKRWSSSSYI